MKRTSLPQVTLCAVDARCPGLAAQSLQRSMAQIDFARVLLFTHNWTPPAPLPGIEVIDIGPITSSAAYSQVVLRQLPAFILTSHVLVTQWDGFVTNAAVWSDEFLQWDYIGAVWPDQPAASCVGNGGFSLRSQRLLQAGLDPRIEHFHPEDLMLCRRYASLLQTEHGVRFAPAAVARRFAFENESPRAPTLGFHGPYNLPRVLDQATLARWLEELPPEFFRSRDARRLARALLAARMPQAAARLLQRRRAAGRTDINTRCLGAVAAVMQHLTRQVP